MSTHKGAHNRPPMHAESLTVRRKLAEAYRRQARNPKLKRRERETFARMGDAWQGTLDER